MKKYYNSPFIEVVKYDVAENIANSGGMISGEGGYEDEW